MDIYVYICIYVGGPNPLICCPTGLPCCATLVSATWTLTVSHDLPPAIYHSSSKLLDDQRVSLSSLNQNISKRILKNIEKRRPDMPRFSSASSSPASSARWQSLKDPTLATDPGSNWPWSGRRPNEMNYTML